MDYPQTLAYLFEKLPMFQRVGAAAFKKDLTNIRLICNHLDNPQEGHYPSIHIAGTNGKGSTAHLISAILQQAGYKVGLYISPHYKDFRERIKVNGTYASKDFVVDFVAKNKQVIEEINPSFFEITVAMAFEYFKQEAVDVAVIEVGMGGRFDSTNIISPLVSIITNIGYDHQQFLGDTLAEIAFEKAGIIKPNISALIGEKHEETTPVFINKAHETVSPISFAEDKILAKLNTQQSDFRYSVYDIYNVQTNSIIYPNLKLALTGNYQQKNIQTVLAAIPILRNYFKISNDAIYKACANVKTLTNIMGRWDILSEKPLTIADSAHNEHGLKYVIEAFKTLSYAKLHIVFGMVNDKEPEKVLNLLPENAIYYFCKADIPRGKNAQQLQQEAAQLNRLGNSYNSVQEAYQAAQQNAGNQDLIYVGGSIFVVAEVL